MALPPAATARNAADPTTVGSIAYGDTFAMARSERVRFAAIDMPEIRKGQAKCAADYMWVTANRVTATRTSLTGSSSSA